LLKKFQFKNFLFLLKNLKKTFEIKPNKINFYNFIFIKILNNFNKNNKDYYKIIKSKNFFKFLNLFFKVDYNSKLLFNFFFFDKKVTKLLVNKNYKNFFLNSCYFIKKNLKINNNFDINLSKNNIFKSPSINNKFIKLVFFYINFNYKKKTELTFKSICNFKQKLYLKEKIKIIISKKKLNKKKIFKLLFTNKKIITLSIINFERLFKKLYTIKNNENHGNEVFLESRYHPCCFC
jgi:hypothetical protein